MWQLNFAGYILAGSRYCRQFIGLHFLFSPLVDRMWSTYFFFLIYLFNFTSQTPLPLPPLLPVLPSSISPPSVPWPFLLRKGEAFHGYQPTLAYKVILRLGTSSSVEARQGSPVSGKESKTEWEIAPALFVRGPALLLHMCKGLRSMSFMLFGWCFSFFEPG